MSNEELISVIIPVYNTEQYVRKCIVSALDQTYKNIEVIVVDDGSNEATRNELRQIEESCCDSRLKIIYAEHQGCAEARNRGLKEASGELLFWLDSDDSIKTTTLSALKEIMDHEDADMVRIDFTQNKPGIVTFNQQAYMQLVLDDQLKSYITATLMKRKLFLGISFQKNNLIEDYAIYPQLCLNSKKVALVRRKDLYLYTVDRRGSITETTGTKIEGLVPRMILAEERYIVFKEQYPKECENVLAQFANYACMVHLHYLQDKTKENYDYAKLAQSLLRQHKKEIADSRIIPVFKKIEAEAIINNSIFCNAILSAHKIKRSIFGVRKKNG